MLQLHSPFVFCRRVSSAGTYANEPKQHLCCSLISSQLYLRKCVCGVSKNRLLLVVSVLVFRSPFMLLKTLMNEQKHTSRKNPKNTLNSSVISHRDYHKSVIKKPWPVTIEFYEFYFSHCKQIHQLNPLRVKCFKYLGTFRS